MNPQSDLLCLLSPASRVPQHHPLRQVKVLVDEVLRDLSPLFNEMYAELGRPSIPPERLLKAKVLQALYPIRSEVLLVEALDYSLLFRWFLDLNLLNPIWDNSTFSQNQTRLLQHRTAELFFARTVGLAREHGWVSDAPFTVDGTLIDAWASLKSFQPKTGPKPPTDGDAGNPCMDFHGERRRNATHESTTDPEARLLRKGQGKEAKRCFGLHALMENRHGLCVQAQVTSATGAARGARPSGRSKPAQLCGIRIPCVFVDKCKGDRQAGTMAVMPGAQGGSTFLRPEAFDEGKELVALALGEGLQIVEDEENFEGTEGFEKEPGPLGVGGFLEVGELQLAGRFGLMIFVVENFLLTELAGGAAGHFRDKGALRSSKGERNARAAGSHLNGGASKATGAWQAASGTGSGEGRSSRAGKLAGHRWGRGRPDSRVVRGLLPRQMEITNGYGRGEAGSGIKAALPELKARRPRPAPCSRRTSRRPGA